MCLGCRQRAGIAELVRVVAPTGASGPRIVVDIAKTMPGRGAWLHPVADCLSAAVRRNAFARALRSPGLVVDQSDLKEVLFTRSGDGTDESGPNGPEQVAEDMSTP
ncbi:MULTISPECIES: YlxR family protein [Gordonia]|uniref:YlxR family protein n=1 Tax=Gordonia TaxID=2053 RepID=UPI000A7CCCF7|nr:MULTISPECIES: YlxR family protein [Gordonia]